MNENDDRMHGTAESMTLARRVEAAGTMEALAAQGLLPQSLTSEIVRLLLDFPSDVPADIVLGVEALAAQADERRDQATITSECWDAWKALLDTTTDGAYWPTEESERALDRLADEDAILPEKYMNSDITPAVSFALDYTAEIFRFAIQAYPVPMLYLLTGIALETFPGELAQAGVDALVVAAMVNVNDGWYESDARAIQMWANSATFATPGSDCPPDFCDCADSYSVEEALVGAALMVNAIQRVAATSASI